MTHHHIKSKIHLMKTGVPVSTGPMKIMREQFLNGSLTLPAGTDMRHISDALLGHETLSRDDVSFKTINAMCDAANYCIDKQVVELLRRSDVVSSIRILLEHGLARLPVSPMLLEFSLAEGYHDFVLLEELHLDPLVLDIRYASLETTTGKAMLTGKSSQLDIAYMEQCLGPKGSNDLENINVLDLYALGAQHQVACVVAARLALLMLNTLGIEREVVETPIKLNRARAKHGRPPIRSSTIVHIGRIYRRDGTSIATGDLRGSMPMHIRQAHVRHVPYGPMKGVPQGDRPTRLTVIPMCIVNYSSDEAAPVVRKNVRA